MNKIVIFILLIGIFASEITPQTQVTIYTPLGSPVPDTWLMPDLTELELEFFQNLMDSVYPSAIILDLSLTCGEFNCHGYAWYTSEGWSKVWIGATTITAEDIFWNDGSYTEDYSTGHEINEKVSYHPDVECNHSAITGIVEQYFYSKWGAGALVGPHLYSYCPFWFSDSYLIYFKRAQNPSIHSSQLPLSNENNLFSTPNPKLKE